MVKRSFGGARAPKTLYLRTSARRRASGIALSMLCRRKELEGDTDRALADGKTRVQSRMQESRSNIQNADHARREASGSRSLFNTWWRDDMGTKSAAGWLGSRLSHGALATKRGRTVACRSRENRMHTPIQGWVTANRNRFLQIGAVSHQPVPVLSKLAFNGGLAPVRPPIFTERTVPVRPRLAAKAECHPGVY